MYFNFELKYNLYMRDNLMNHLAHIIYFIFGYMILI
jgi:hypothetical protein